MAGVAVSLRQISWCSPTSGQHQTTTGVDGKFVFSVFVHDTDSFKVGGEIEGYEPGQQLFGGFNCLYCHCPPIKILLRSNK